MEDGREQEYGFKKETVSFNSVLYDGIYRKNRKRLKGLFL